MKTIDSPPTNPFPGLRPFRSDEHHLFFGREEQTSALLQLLRTNRFLAVVGTSGSGKSSLVRAGMIAELYGGTMTQAGSTWEVMILRPGGSPIENLARAFVDAQLYDPEDPSTLPRLLATLNRSRFGLVEAMKQCELFEPGTNLLVVVDQFEELFRFRQQGVDSEETAAAFVNLLLTASEQSECPIYVTITMRSDYLGDCSEIPGLAEAVNEGEYLIPRLLRDQKRDAIEKPIGVGGARIAPMLVQRLLNDVGDDPDQLPVLQHALMRMWDAWSAGGSHDRPIDFSDFEATGGLGAALSNHADEIYDALPDDRHRSICEKIFKTLTEKGDDNRGIRRPTRLSHLQAIANADRDAVMTVLEAYRGAGVTFLMPGPEVKLDDRTVLDLSHESLMRGWERLRMWVEEEAQSARIFRRLLDTARLWGDGKAGLFRDPDLQIALSWREQEAPNSEWAEQYGGDFETAIGFLETSNTEVEAERQARETARRRELEQARQLAEAQQLRLAQQQRSARGLRKMIAGLAAVAVIAVLACIAALFANQRAVTLAAEARRNEENATQNANRADQSQQETARALALVATQKSQVEESLSKAQSAERLARDAEEKGRKLLYTTDMRLAPFVWRDDRTTAEQLRSLLARHIPGDPPADGKGIADAPLKSDLRGFEWRYYQYLLESSADVFSGHNQAVIAGTITADGPLVTLDQNGQLRHWNPSTQADDEAGRLDLPGGPDAQLRVLSPDGRLAALAEADEVRVFDASTGKESFRIPSANVEFRKLAFSGDSEKLVIVDDKIRWCDARNGGVTASLDQKYQRVESLALSADGLTMAVVGHSPLGDRISSFRLDATTKTVTPPKDFNSVGSSLAASAMTSDGKHLAVGAMLMGALYVFDPATGRGIAQHQAAHASPIMSMAFSRDGARLATADAEGTIKIWSDLPDLNSKSTAILTLKGHRGAIHGIGFSIDGRRLVTTSSDKTARVWDLENAGAAIRPLENASENGLLTARFSPDGRLIAGVDGGKTVHLYDAASGRLVRVLPPIEKGQVLSVAFSPTDPHLIAVGYGGAADVSHVSLWDIDSGTELARLSGATDFPGFAVTDTNGAVGALAFSPDGQWLVAGFGSFNMLMPSGWPIPVKVWEVATRRLIRRLDGHTNFCVSLDFSRDGSMLASGCHDGTAILWSTATWKAIHTLRNPDQDSVFREMGRPGMVKGVAFTPDGKTLAMASREANVHLWDVATGRRLDTLKGHSHSVESVVFSPDGKTLATSSSDRTVRLWNVETRRELLQMDPGGVDLSGARSLVFSPDGRQLLAAGGTPVFWSTSSSVWNNADRAAEELRHWLRSSVDFRSRIRMVSENLRLHEALAKLDAKDPRVRAALAATQANWHASRKAWPEAVLALDRLEAADPASPGDWLRTPGLLRLATALLHRDQPMRAARLLQGGAKRRGQDGLPPASHSVSLGLNLTRSRGGFRLAQPPPESPAARSGLASGDVVLKLDGAELTDEAFARFTAAPAGDVGTKLRLTIRRGGIKPPEEVELTWERFLLDPATGDLMRPLRAAIDERLALQPDDPRLLDLRAELAGQWSDAGTQVADTTAALESLARQKSELPAADLERLYRCRGEAYFARGEWKHALDDFERAKVETSGDVSVQADQAMARANHLLASVSDETWKVITPVEMKSKAGAVLTRQKDGSILVSGANERGDVYTLSAVVDLDRIAAVRLEVLPDDSLPSKGPGRNSSGNFQLSAFRLYEATGEGQEGLKPLPVGDAWASFDYKAADADVAGTVDETRKTFWHVWGRVGEAHEAVFRVREAPAITRGHTLVFELRHRSTDMLLNLGRFRLSVSDNPAARDVQSRQLILRKITDPWEKLASVYRLQGKPEAIDAMVERDPKLAGRLGDLFARGEDRDWRRAVALYTRGITEKTTDIDLLAKRARAFEELKEWGAAAADWSRAAKGNPNGANRLEEFARRLAAANQAQLARTTFETAQTLYERALESDPDSELIAADLAQLLQDRASVLKADWTVLSPVGTKTEGGAKLTRGDDGSFLVEVAPESRGEAVRLQPGPGPVRALRVETSTHRSPPENGAPIFNEYQIVAADMAAALRGRFVRVDLPGDNALFPRQPSDKEKKFIHLAEVQVFQGERNIALRKKARQSSDYNSSTMRAGNAVDGNTVGDDNRNFYAHTRDGDNAPWWEVDLGSEQTIDRMVVWNRSNPTYYLRLNHFRIRVLDDRRNVVFEQVVSKAPDPSTEITRPSLLGEARTATAGESSPLIVRLPLTANQNAPARFRVSTSDRLPTPVLDEDVRVSRNSAVVTARLAAGYAMNDRHDAALRLFETALNRAENYESKRAIVGLASHFDPILSALVERRSVDPLLALALARIQEERGEHLLAEKQPGRALVELQKSRASYVRLRERFPEPRWSVLSLTKTESAGGATLTRQDDGSILVTGKNPAMDTYTLTAPIAGGPISALRLEAIPDKRLPGGGAGRYEQFGEFLLAEIEATLKSSDGSERALTITEGFADFASPGQPLANAFDSNFATYWGVKPDLARPHTAIFRLRPPSEGRHGEQELSVRIRCGARAWARLNLGRFRLSVTRDAFEVARVRDDLTRGDLLELNLALAKAHAEQGHVDEAIDAFAEALPLAADRAGKARIVVEAAILKGDLEKLAERAPGDALFQAELARHFADLGNAPLADAARTRTRLLLEQKLAKEPEDSASASMLAGLLLEPDVSAWRVLVPSEMKSKSGTTLTLKSDHSVLASGPVPQQEAYTFAFEKLPETIRGLRLEVLPDASLPQNGPGRSSNGNLILTEITAKLRSSDQGPEQPLQWKRAAASHEQTANGADLHNYLISAAIDRDETSSNDGWAILPELGKAQSALFELDGDLAAGEGSTLTVTLVQRYSGHSIGRCRLSIPRDRAVLDRELKRLTAMNLNDPWAKLGAAYVLVGDMPRAADLLAKSAEKGEIAPWQPIIALSDQLLDSLKARHPRPYATILSGLATAAAERGQIDQARALYARLSASHLENALWKERAEQLRAGVLAAWHFDQAPGSWRDARNRELLAKGGILTVRATEGVPSCSVPVDGPAGGKSLVLRYRTDEAFTMKVFWSDSSGALDESRHGDYPLPAAAGAWREAVIPFSTRGRLDLLRLIPNIAPQHPLEIDSILLREWEPGDLEHLPSDVALLIRLGDASEAAGHTREALPLLARASADDPKNTSLSLRVAALQAWFGQEEELAASRRRILAFAKANHEGVTAERATKACSILPSSDKTELEAILALGHSAVQAGPTVDWNLLALGMAEYRSGRFGEADARLAQVTDPDKHTPVVASSAAFYRAMSLFQQGKKDEARKLAAAAAARMKPSPADEENPLAVGDYYEDLIAWLAYKETKALIGSDAAPAAPAGK